MSSLFIRWSKLAVWSWVIYNGATYPINTYLAMHSMKSIQQSDDNALEYSDQFLKLFDCLENQRQNMFITGKAGTGKSTFLRYFLEHTDKEVVVLAPTGIAALNIAGQTIHSFFRIKPGLIDLDRIGRRKQRNLYESLDMIIIDEISMVRADLFDAMEKFMRLNGPHRGATFGGVQVVVIGDLYQLPPVVTDKEQDIFSNFYPSPFFFSAACYQACHFEVTEFTKIYRQSEQRFIDSLNRIRNGTVCLNTIDYLNERCGIAESSPSTQAVTLTTTNYLAEKINKTHLHSLSGEIREYEGVLSGELGVHAERLPAPKILQLKVGAQIMFTKNDVDKRWVNGSLGTIKALGKSSITVTLADERLVVVKTDSWESLRYQLDPETGAMAQKVVGRYKQFPLLLAWAVTIHKSQGQTLDNVIIDLGYKVFAPGQLYVALSRCKTYEGLVLKRPINPHDIICDIKVQSFMRQATKPKIDF